MPSPSRKFYDPLEYYDEMVQKEEQNRRVIEEAQRYAEDLIRRGHCPICLTVNCSGHGI